MKIRAGASLKASIQPRQFESIGPGFFADIEFEVPNDMPEEEVKRLIGYWQDNLRDICEDKVDRDIRAIREMSKGNK